MKHTVQEIDVNPDLLNRSRELYSQNQDQMEEYIDLLLDWNQKINLVSRNVSRETVREHVIHSLLPAPLTLMDGIDEWIDSGTGGGLPGIPLAIAETKKMFYLNDNVKKKMRAVAEIVQAMELTNVETIPKSISLVGMKTGAGIITKHAFKIDDLLRHLRKKPWKRVIMWKGVEGAKKEIHRTGHKVDCTIYKFQFGEEFYQGKGLVVLKK